MGGKTARTCVPLFARFSLKRAHPPEAISLTTAGPCRVVTPHFYLPIDKNFVMGQNYRFWVYLPISLTGICKIL
jgi:hypothetical protein